ncbi:MAG: DNA-binding protein, partial [Bacteroidetes bacterium]|nr:DNA-binding protein [Bacteroidota bacterium]
HPLLGNSFGKENYTLYIYKEIDIELKRSSRLQTKFYWIEQEQYINNRKKRLAISKQKQADIEDTYEHIWQYQKDYELNLSREDIYCIATALEENVKLVTDDKNMIKTCKEFGVTVLSTLQLLRLMEDNECIDNTTVKQIVDYWKYEKDLPADFNSDFKLLFRNKSNKK